MPKHRAKTMIIRLQNQDFSMLKSPRSDQKNRAYQSSKPQQPNFGPLHRPVMNITKLSQQQKNILAWAYKRMLERQSDHTHIRVTPSDDRRKTLSGRASVSRSIAKLVSRGLLLRSYESGTVTLRFTDIGREVAKPLYEAWQQD